MRWAAMIKASFLKRLLAVAAFVLGLWCVPSLAHHSFAMFDAGKLATIEGTVKEFQWTNPHTIAWIEVPSAGGGESTTWPMEMASPANLTRMGWTKRSLKPGDKVRVEFNPLRDGSPGGNLKKATVLSTGEVFTTQSLTGAVFGSDVKQPY